MTRSRESDFAAVLASLTASQARLAVAVEALAPAEVEAPSYNADWSLAETLSHLGSGAEIFGLIVAAGVAGEPAPGPDRFQTVWDVWNAKKPADQTRDALTSNDALMRQLQALTPDQITAWELDVFGAVQSLPEVLRMRISEHVMHTWDVEVMADKAAVIPEDAAALILELQPRFVGWVGKPTDSPLTVRVETAEPAGTYLLTLDTSGVQFSADDPSAPVGATLHCSADAFLRLVYGRLDPSHTPALQLEGVQLDRLRASFPGF